MSKLSLSVEKYRPHEPVAIIPGASRTGLSLPPGLSFDAWQGVGETLGEISSAHQWWVGDWWLYGEREYGEMASQAAGMGIDPGTLSDWAAVADRVPLPLRNGNLSWSHHRAVAYLDHKDQAGWLQVASDENLDVRLVTRSLDAYKPTVQAVTEDELLRAMTCGPEARRCVCGGVVVADPLDPEDGVRDHQTSERHGRWRAWRES